MDPQPRMIPRRPRPDGPWLHGPIPVVGLIGGIGGGKSRVAALLAGRGAQVFDADAVGHALLRTRAVRERVVARFGPGVLGDSQGVPAIDRRALAAIVFADPDARRDLEAIVHPRMRRIFERAIAWTVRRGHARAVVLDAAILLETGWDVLCDRVVYVDAPRDQRLARLTAQRGWTEEGLRARESAQWPAESKRARADVVLANDADLGTLEGAVDLFCESLLGSTARPVAPPASDRAGARGRSPSPRGQPHAVAAPSAGEVTIADERP